MSAATVDRQRSQPSRLTADRCCEQDVEDLSELLRYLQRRRGAKRIAIVGHSTGCQVIVHFMATADEELRRIVQLCVLQAPVSDREAAEGSGVGPEVVTTARRHVDAGEGETLVHSLYGIAPLSAQRTVDLFERMGKDDMFSSDLSSAELSARLQHMAAVPTMLALSMADEYVPCAKQPGEYSALGARMAAAAEAEVLELADADHALSKPAAASKRFVHEVSARLGAISRGETLRPAPQAAAPEPEPVLAAHRQQRSLAATRAASIAQLQASMGGRDSWDF